MLIANMMTQPPLFQDNFVAKPAMENLQEGVVLIRHAFNSEELFAAIKTVIEAAPLRHMETPGGKKMSVSMTNCGNLGWTSNRAGYGYTKTDPETKLPWPTMPPLLFDTAVKPASPMTSGRYEDVLVKTYDGWKFESRTVRPDPIPKPAA